jgi:hypothetical protein
MLPSIGVVKAKPVFLLKMAPGLIIRSRAWTAQSAIRVGVGGRRYARAMTARRMVVDLPGIDIQEQITWQKIQKHLLHGQDGP